MFTHLKTQQLLQEREKINPIIEWLGRQTYSKYKIYNQIYLSVQFKYTKGSN